MSDRTIPPYCEESIRVVSLFCGIGGADLGLYAAAEELGVEVEVVDAIDSWEPAVRVYNANHRHPVARVADVKKLARADLPPHDLVIGGPPCQDHSLAGQRKCKCNAGGNVTERCCLADFVRLADGSAWIMENVVARLINAPWSDKLQADHYGDVTSRKRWFYSNYLLHVIQTPGTRRIRDIRDHDEDLRVSAKRRIGQSRPSDDDDVLGTITASPHGGVGGFLLVTHRPRTNEQGCEPYASVAGDDGVFGSLTADMPRAYSGTELTQSEARLRLGLRGNSASAFNDDEVLGSLLANAFHANEASKLVGCRNPSILEMARAHSIHDSWDWAGATKTQRGQMIANCWPASMAKAVCKAMLTALVAERERAA
jgi:site-specific DNA-cytosine methylase